MVWGGGIPCRWRYYQDQLEEQRSSEYGVAGFFIFKDKSYLADVPTDGEFVRWLQSKGYKFDTQILQGIHEYGLYDEWDKLPKLRTRPFNRIEIKDDKLYKIPVDDQGRSLAVREQAWYKSLRERKFDNIPKIYGYDPLCMEKVDGKNIWEYPDLDQDRKKSILKQVIECLKEVHQLDSEPANEESYRIAYLDKTYDRLEKVRELVPFAQDETVRINGRICRNIFFHQEEVEKLVMAYLPNEFRLIHGDCTFSNMMLKHDTTPMLIDPRGYFGNTELLGDVAYDWVKLYYSLYSNYDQFNLKRFDLYINQENVPAVFDDRGNEVEVGPRCVKLEVASNRWESLEDDYFDFLKGEVTRRQMKLFLAITWLSLTTYAWEDYDSICGAFYMGLYYLEEALSMTDENTMAVDDEDSSSAYEKYFRNNVDVIVSSLKSVKLSQFEALVDECETTLLSGNKVVVSGLGKNAPVCDKFVGMMLSMGMSAAFLHTNTAVHGDMGMVRPGDLVIVLTKSGSTAESVYLVDLLKRRRGVTLWLLSFSEHSELADSMDKKLIVKMEHEGDPWNIVPNNSTTLTLIILQNLALELAGRLHLDLLRDFKPNHPGGAIGANLRYKS